MQAYVAVKREAGPVLNVLLFFVVLTLAIGGACLALGLKIGGSFSSVSSVASSFWWGGATLLFLGGFYIPCHILVKQGSSSGRCLFILWTFLIGIGFVVILASTGITAYVWTLVKVVTPNECVYVSESKVPSGFECTIPCGVGLLNKFGYIPSKTCCCCENNYEGEVIYAQNVDNCDIFKNSIDLALPLAGLYIGSLVLILIDMVMGYVVACGCCDVQVPWFEHPTTTVQTTRVVMSTPYSAHVETGPPAYGVSKTVYA